MTSLVADKELFRELFLLPTSMSTVLAAAFCGEARAAIAIAVEPPRTTDLLPEDKSAWSWREARSCKGVLNATFFPESDGKGEKKQKEAAESKASAMTANLCIFYQKRVTS